MKKKTLLFSFIGPAFLLFYIWTLADLNVGVSSSLFPYLKKYPYPFFEWAAQERWGWFVISNIFAFPLLAWLIIWTKTVWDKKVISARSRKVGTHKVKKM